MIIMSNRISIKDFLKLYTAVDEKFIDNYYVFYEKCAELSIKYDKKFTNKNVDSYVIFNN